MGAASNADKKDEVADLIMILRKRSRNSRYAAFGILVIIFLLLAGGATTFVLAPQITLSDLYPQKNLDEKLKSVERELYFRKGEFDTAFSLWQEQISRPVSTIKSILEKYDSSPKRVPAQSSKSSDSIFIDLEKSETYSLQLQTMSNRLLDNQIFPDGDVSVFVDDSITGSAWMYRIEAKNRRALAADFLKVSPIPAIKKPSNENLSTAQKARDWIIERQKAEKLNELADIIQNSRTNGGVLGDVNAKTSIPQLVQTNITRFLNNNHDNISCFNFDSSL